MNRLLLVLLLLSGCTGAHRYGLPRTLAPGKSAHLFSLDVSRAVNCRGGALSDEGAAVCGYGEMPSLSYDYRRGVAERVEIGAGVSLDASVRVDTKLEFLRTAIVDAAIVPSLSAYRALPTGTFSADEQTPTAVAMTLPLLVGIRAGDLYLVPGAGISWVGTASRQRLLESGALTVFARVGGDVLVGPGVTVTGPGDSGADPIIGFGFTVQVGDPFEGGET